MYDLLLRILIFFTLPSFGPIGLLAAESSDPAEAHAPPADAATATAVTGPYFGQTPPGKIPELFASEILSLPNRRVTRLAFSPDGRECFFSAPNDDFSQVQMYCMKCVDNVWTPRFLAPFVRPGRSYRQAIYSVDGNRLHFSSNVNGNSDLWVVARTAQGWGEPQALPAPINTASYEGQHTQAADGTAFFESDRPGGQGTFDIWRISPSEPGQSPQVENLGPLVNSSAGDSDPFVAPDGSYLLFSSERSGGCGQSDLYVTFPDGKGGWTAPANLNRYCPGINTDAYEYVPAPSADGRFLFFTRLINDVPQKSGIYWVKNPLSERNANSTK